jgi:hypothetical protein
LLVNWMQGPGGNHHLVFVKFAGTLSLFVGRLVEETPYFGEAVLAKIVPGDGTLFTAHA